MEKPAEIKKLYRIAAILFAAGIMLQCGIPTVAALIPIISYQPSMNVNLDSTVLYLIYTMPLLVYLFLAIWLACQTKITRESTKLTAILIPVAYSVVQILRLLIPFVGRLFLSNESLSLFRTGSSGYGVFGLFYTAGLILICCAAAVEYYRMLPARTGTETRPLSLYAVICSGAGVALKCVAVFMARLIGLVFDADGMGLLVLPLKWKLLLIGTILLSDLPLICAAVWFWLKPEVTRTFAKTKLILVPILYWIPSFLSSIARTFMVRDIVNEGVPVVSAYGTATAAVALFGVLIYAAMLLMCCAGAIELCMTKQAPSDGEKEETT